MPWVPTYAAMVGQQPKERMPEVWAIADVSLVLLRDRPVFQTVVPSKIFESMAMRRPIILGVRGESELIVRESRTGVCITPESDIELVEAVVTLAEDSARCSALGRAGSDFVKQQFDRTNLARCYERLIVSVVK